MYFSMLEFVIVLTGSVQGEMVVNAEKFQRSLLRLGRIDIEGD